MPKIYTDEFKGDAVALVESGISQRQVCRDLGISKTALATWVKDARFSPGTVDGSPQAICGHTVVYEWRLEDVR